MPDLSRKEVDFLRRLVGAMIPAAPAYDAPGADDPAIFEDIVAALQDSGALLQGLLADLAAGAPGAISAADVEAEFDRLRQNYAAAFAAIIAAVAQCYYRDDRVMRALGMEPRPPFPKGYEVVEGDWPLLDAVRRRPPIWRRAD
jgi:hypothetical protein